MTLKTEKRDRQASIPPLLTSGKNQDVPKMQRHWLGARARAVGLSCSLGWGRVASDEGGCKHRAATIHLVFSYVQCELAVAARPDTFAKTPQVLKSHGCPVRWGGIYSPYRRSRMVWAWPVRLVMFLAWSTLRTSQIDAHNSGQRCVQHKRSAPQSRLGRCAFTQCC